MKLFYRNQCGNRTEIGRFFTAKITVPYIYLPSGSVSAVASLLLIHRFEGICTASGPIRSSDDTSSSPRRAIVLVALLVAPKSMLVAEAFREGFGEGFRTVARTVCQTVSAVSR